MKRTLLMLMLACLTLGLLGCGDSPGDRVKAFTYAFEKGDTATVKEIAPSIAAIIPAEKLDGMVKQSAAEIKGKGGIKSIKIDNETVTGDTAKVKATATFGNGTSETEDYELTKIDGDWIISIGNEQKDPSAMPE